MRLKLNAGYAGIHAAHWMVNAAVTTFAAAFLLNRGYTNSQIGLILAAGNIVSIVIQPPLADFSDHSKKISLIGVTETVNVMIGVLAVFCLLMKHGCAALSAVYVVMLALHLALQPLINSLAFRLSDSGYFINFGVTRAMGSLSYAALCAVLGTLMEMFGADVAPFCAAVMIVVLLATLAVVEKMYKKACAQRDALGAYAPVTVSGGGNAESVPEQEISLLDFVRRNKMFLVANVGIFGFFFSTSIVNNFMLQIMQSVGGTSAQMGRSQAIMALVEIVPLFLFERIHRHFSNKRLLQFSAVCFLVKIILMYLAKSVFLLYVAQCFQITSFGLFLPSIVSYINELMDKGEAVKGQALYTMMVSASSVAASLAGGFILDWRGASALLLVSSAVTAVGVLVFVLAVEQVKSKKIVE